MRAITDSHTQLPAATATGYRLSDMRAITDSQTQLASSKTNEKAHTEHRDDLAPSFYPLTKT
jgi:hypothetical protein